MKKINKPIQIILLMI